MKPFLESLKAAFLWGWREGELKPQCSLGEKVAKFLQGVILLDFQDIATPKQMNATDIERLLLCLPCEEFGKLVVFRQREFEELMKQIGITVPA